MIRKTQPRCYYLTCREEALAEESYFNTRRKYMMMSGFEHRRSLDNSENDTSTTNINIAHENIDADVTA